MTGTIESYLSGCLQSRGFQILDRDESHIRLSVPADYAPEDILEMEFISGLKITPVENTGALEPTGAQEPSRSHPAIQFADDSPTQIVDDILKKAVELQASDIHFEPYENNIRIRFRLDGVLHTVASLRSAQKDSVCSRLKILASLDIAEKRRPQDGRISFIVDDRTVDFRVSTLPTRFGEKVVLRLLDKHQVLLELPSLGMSDRDQAILRRTLGLTHGMALVTGPTGSGKTTTLYAALQALDHDHANVVTIEDPIEYDLPGINQAQVKADIGFTFAAALRTFLRQDPDIIMVGEIRDRETAEIAVRAALTGHLVLSTLHTNDAPSTISRLLDMGIEPFLIASSLRLVVAQRLVRRNCTECLQPQSASEAIRLDLDSTLEEFHEGAGCASCNGTGFKGRAAVFEMLPISEPIAEAVTSRSNTATLGRIARDSGMQSLRESACELIRQGITTPAEVMRETAVS